MHQAFLNLLLNAIQAMPEGGRLTVSTQPGPQGQRRRDPVRRIPATALTPRALKKILNPFFTTKEKGSGLGLPIVKSIIETHQGSLKIDSDAGQGTVVTITLPELSLKKVACK